LIEKPKEIMYLTDNIEKAKVAKQLELRIIIINRDDKHYSTQDIVRFGRHSFLL
jgi:methionine salvage enolase-phosphatase E1